jgi:sugar phosphate isomerase/epimerase
MQLSCHSWAFSDLTLPEALGTIARMGFRYVDIGSGPHFNMVRAANPGTRRAIAEELRDDLELFNLKITDMYLMLPRISLSDEQKRRTDITLFKALVPMMKALEAPGVTLSAGVVHPADDTEAYERTTSALIEMLESAQKADLPISIEPYPNSMVTSPEQALKLVEDVPGLQLTLDWGYLIQEKVKAKEIEPLLPYARHIHVKQSATNKLQVPFDKGNLDVSDLFEQLQSAAYDGALCIEYLPTEWQNKKGANIVEEIMLLRDALRDARAAT